MGGGGLLFDPVPPGAVHALWPHGCPGTGSRGVNGVGSRPGLSVHRIRLFADVAEMTVACAARPGAG